MEEAIERIVLTYLQGVKSPPTDLNSVGTKLAVKSIDVEDIVGSGELRRDGSGYRIVYCHGLSVGRRRFTIAHEMAHIVVEGTGPHPPRSGRELERLCDMFAAELLMPRQEFMARARGEISTRRILELADCFQTSVSTTGLRYADLCGVSVFEIQGSCMTWGRGVVRPAKDGSFDRALRPAVETAHTERKGSDEIFLSSSNSYRRWHVECRAITAGKTGESKIIGVLRPETSRRPTPTPGRDFELGGSFGTDSRNPLALKAD
jgi:hypothetical protein